MISIPTKNGQFQPGQLVKHRHYSYRGVVVALDEECQAPDQWYQKNRTHPMRQQPWYHVLVHGSDRTTYAAQENLEVDPHPLAIEHPLLDVFFSEFKDNRYVRNDKPWIGW